MGFHFFYFQTLGNINESIRLIVKKIPSKRMHRVFATSSERQKRKRQDTFERDLITVLNRNAPTCAGVLRKYRQTASPFDVKMSLRDKYLMIHWTDLKQMKIFHEVLE